MQELESGAFGNPHSSNPSSARTEAAVEAVRARLLAFLGADPEEYEVGRGGGGSLVGESRVGQPRGVVHAGGERRPRNPGRNSPPLPSPPPPLSLSPTSLLRKSSSQLHRG